MCQLPVLQAIAGAGHTAKRRSPRVSSQRRTPKMLSAASESVSAVETKTITFLTSLLNLSSLMAEYSCGSSSSLTIMVAI